jgi:hypothetical protein
MEAQMNAADADITKRLAWAPLPGGGRCERRPSPRGKGAIEWAPFLRVAAQRLQPVGGSLTDRAAWRKANIVDEGELNEMGAGESRQRTPKALQLKRL